MQRYAYSTYRCGTLQSISSANFNLRHGRRASVATPKGMRSAGEVTLLLLLEKDKQETGKKQSKPEPEVEWRVASGEWRPLGALDVKPNRLLLCVLFSISRVANVWIFSHFLQHWSAFGFQRIFSVQSACFGSAINVVARQGPILESPFRCVVRIHSCSFNMATCCELG